MANPDLRSLDEIQSKGGSNLGYKEVKSTGEDLTIPDTWHTMPYRSKSTMDPKISTTRAEGEDGKLLKVLDDKEEPSLVIISLQDSAKLENFIRYDSKDKYFAIFMDCGSIDGGATKERFIPIVQFDRNYKIDAPGRTPEIKMNFYVTPADVTPASLPSWAVGEEAAFKVVEGRYDAVNDSKKIV